MQRSGEANVPQRFDPDKPSRRLRAGARIGKDMALDT